MSEEITDAEMTEAVSTGYARLSDGGLLMGMPLSEITGEDAPGNEPASEVRPGHGDCCTTGNAAAARKCIEDGLDEDTGRPEEAHRSLLAGIGYALLAVHGVLDRAVALAAEAGRAPLDEATRRWHATGVPGERYDANEFRIRHGLEAL